MVKLNLTAKNKEQEIILNYLQNNASQNLADKINNGVKIIKDHVVLINKKDLETFWQYAYQEAKKLRQNNANTVAVDDQTVFGWAIHYFEEDSIEGKLVYEDGREYKTAPTKPQTEPAQKPEIKKEPEPQTSIFDLFDSTPIHIPEPKVVTTVTPKIDPMVTQTNIKPPKNDNDDIVQFLMTTFDGKVVIK